MNKYKSEKNFNFKGEMHFENKYKLYKNTDVLLCTSRDDPMPVVVSEAMSLEIPTLVTSQVEQYSYIEDYINGF